MASLAPPKFGWGGDRRSSAGEKRKACDMERWVHPNAESAHKEWVAASRCKFRGIEENCNALFIDVPSWMWLV